MSRPPRSSPRTRASGALLTELGRARESLAAYEAALDRWPNRFHGLLSAARAARAAGEPAAARTHYARLLEVVDEDAAGASEVAEAKRFLSAADRARRSRSTAPGQVGSWWVPRR